MDDPYTLIRELQNQIQAIEAARGEDARRMGERLRRLEEEQQLRLEAVQELAKVLWLGGADKEAASVTEGGLSQETRRPLRVVPEPPRRRHSVVVCAAGAAAVVLVAALCWQALADGGGSAVRVAEGPPPGVVQRIPPASTPGPWPVPGQHGEADDQRGSGGRDDSEPRPDMFGPGSGPAPVTGTPRSTGDEPDTTETREPEPPPADDDTVAAPGGCTRKIVAVRRVLGACP